MDLDWNWFFAAFAQCAAALIGIIAAFTISKLLSEGEKVEDHSNSINEMHLHRLDLLRKIEDRRFNWHDRLNIEYSYELKKAIENGEFDNLSQEEALIKLKSIEPDLFGVEACITYLADKIREVKKKTTRPTSGPFDIQFELPSFDTIPPANLWENLRKEKDKINSIMLDAIKLTEWFKSKKAELKSKENNVKPIKNTIYILIFGMFTTIIYPLHFMPIKSNKFPNMGLSVDIILYNLFSVKGMLLTLLVITIVGLFLYFLSIINKIERQYKALTNTIGTEHQDLCQYSNYFEQENYNNEIKRTD